MSSTTIQEQIVREAPNIEAYKLGLLESARSRVLTANDVPTIQVAGLDPQQQEAIRRAGMGVGAYESYLDDARARYGEARTGFQAIPGLGTQATTAANQARTDALARYNAIPALATQGLAASDAARALAQTQYSGLGEIGQAGQAAATGYATSAAGYGQSGTAAYNPNSVFAYMNPYQQAVTQNALAEMGRQAQIQQQQLSAQAVRSGAFGGSREGVQRAELGRNLAEVQSKRVLEDYFANYSQAQQAAMNAFANQQARTQNAGNIALGAGQLGMQGANLAGNLQQGEASGLASLGQLGMQSATAAGQLQQAAGAGIMGLGQLSANTALQAGQLQQASAAGLGTVGQQTAALGQLESGLAQGDVSFLFNIGTQQQQQRQRELDAQRQTQLQRTYEPYQRLAFLSDIYKGAPSSQMTIGQATAPAPSLVSQVAGLGTAGLAAYNLMR